MSTTWSSDGSRSKREVVRHCLASAILAINDKDEVLLERQYRYPYDEIITEIPAGNAIRAKTR